MVIGIPARSPFSKRPRFYPARDPAREPATFSKLPRWDPAGDPANTPQIHFPTVYLDCPISPCLSTPNPAGKVWHFPAAFVPDSSMFVSSVPSPLDKLRLGSPGWTLEQHASNREGRRARWTLERLRETMPSALRDLGRELNQRRHAKPGSAEK